MAYWKIKGDTQSNTVTGEYKSIPFATDSVGYLLVYVHQMDQSFQRLPILFYHHHPAPQIELVCRLQKYQYTSSETTIWHNKGLYFSNIILFKVIEIDKHYTSLVLNSDRLYMM